MLRARSVLSLSALATVVFLVLLAPSDPRAVPPGQAGAAAPATGKIVFVRGFAEGWVVAARGGRPRRLPIRTRVEWPDLSRDGRRLVWVDVGRLGILVGTAEGRRSRRIVRSGLGLGGPIMPRWSPSGRAIAFVRGVPPPRDWGASFSQIFVAELRGGRPRRLETTASLLYPSWSPDGRKIVAQGETRELVCPVIPWVCQGVPRYGLWLVDVRTEAAREIVRLDDDFVGRPLWSPDGRAIVFTRVDDPESPSSLPEAWLVRPNGSGLRRLTGIPRGASVASWSPDGRRFALELPKGRTRRDIATVRLDGSGMRRLTRGAFDTGADWAP